MRDKTNTALQLEVKKLEQRILELETSQQELKVTNLQLQETKDQEIATVNQRMKASDDMLSKSEAHFKTLASNIEAIVYIIDTDGTFLLSEGRGLAKLGLVAGQVVGASVYDLYKDHPEMLNAMERAFKGERTTIEVLVGEIHYSSWYSPYRDDRGEIAGLLGLSVDVTERKNAEDELLAANQQLRATEQQLRASNQQLRASNQQLRATEQQLRANELSLIESENRYRTLAEAAQDNIFVINEGRISYVNPTGARFFGKPVNQVRGQLLEQLFPPDAVRHHQAAISRVIATGRPENSLTCLPLPGGERWLDTTMVSLPGASGNQSVMGISRDVSDKMFSEQRHSAVLSATLDGYWLVNTEGRFLDVNNSYLKMTGYSREEFLSMKITDVEKIEDPEETAAHLEKVMATGGDQFETLHRRKDGTVMDADVSVTFLALEGGLMVVFIRDITIRKQAEQELRRSEHIVSSSSDMLAFLDCDYVYRAVNNEYATAFNRRKDELVGQSVAQVFGPQFFAEVIKPHADRCLAGETICYQEWFDFPAHEPRWMKIIYSPYFDNGTHVAGITVNGRNLTDQKQAEEALRESESKLLEAQKLAQMGNWFWDVDSGEVEWSDEVFNIFQLDPKDFTPQIDSILDLSPWPDERQRDQELIQKAIDSHEAGSYVQRFLRPDGSTGHYFSTFKGIYDNGKLTAIRGTVQDITVRKQAEAKIEHLNEVLRAIRSVNHLIFKERDPQKLLQGACDRLTETRGYLRAWIALFDEDRKATATFQSGMDTSFAPLVELLRRGELVGCAKRGLDQNGLIVVKVPVSECDTCPLSKQYSNRGGLCARLSHRGKVFGVLSVSVPKEFIQDKEEQTLFKEVAADVSYALYSIEIEAERKLAEEALHLKNQVFESSLAAMSIADVDGIITQVNPAFLALWGYGSKEEAIGGSVGNFFFDEADAGSVFEALVSSGRWEGEFFARRADGTKFVSHGLATAMKDERGELIGYQSANLDITQQRRTEEDIVTLNKELDQRVAARTLELTAVNKELEAFAYSVSHDLRAPLRGIDGFSKALLDDYNDKLDDTGKDYIHRVRAGTQRMGRLIDDLLKLSRLTRVEMHHHHLDIDELATKIIADLRTQEPERKVDVKVSPGLSAQGDRVLLEVALDNLLRNAWKFTGNCAHARIEFGVNEQNGERVYFVRDNGAGFDMAFSDKLFGAFQRLHDTAEFPGSGIGLAIVKRVIQRHGGRIWAEAEVDSGATFYFTLQTSREADCEGAKL